MELDYIEKRIDNFLNGNKNSVINLSELKPEDAKLGELINRLFESQIKNFAEKEFFYEALMKTPVPMALLDTSLNIIDINDAFTEISGNSKEKMTRFNLSDFHSEFKIKHIEGKGTKDVLETKSKVSGKFEMTFKGIKKIIEIESIPLMDKKGGIININTVLIDITDLDNQKTWYEAILDSIPFPVSVTDMDMNWTYMNPATAGMANVDKKQALGTHCSRWNANICKTKNCGIECLRRGDDVTYFEQDGGNYMVNLAWIKDAEGKKTGHVEIIQDISATVKVAEYLEEEVAKVATDLESIAKGRPQDLKLKVGEADKYTKEVRQKFLDITASVGSVNDTLLNLVADIQNLVKAGEDGRLEYRANTAKYEGAYVGLVENLNNLLETTEVPLKEAMNVCNSYSNADFTKQFSDKIPVKGDFLEFKTAVDNIGISVSELLEESNKVTKMIVSNSKEVSKGTDEVAKAAEGVANTSQKTADLTKDLLQNIENVNRQIADLSASNEEIASTSQEVFNAANHVVAIGKEAQSLGNDANTKMINVEKIAEESVAEIKELTDKVKEVGKIVKLINDIAGQINLLALNAAIEAARAGEHGRGFAVVAGEVKNLAGEARAATDSIENVVSMVQSSSEKTAKAITAANDEIVEGVESVTNAIEALNTIIKNAGQVSNDIGEITKAIEDQANISNNVVKAMDSGTEQTKKVQKEAEELAALAEEASASIEEIGSAMHEVSTYVNELEAANSKFKY